MTQRRAFTLIELLVVIGIIALLVGILIPTIRHVQTSARAASTRSFVSALSAAIERYYGDFKAYPGPFSNLMCENGSPDADNKKIAPPPFTPQQLQFDSGATSAYVSTPLTQDKITSSENLVLGLLGGLKVDTTTPNQPKLIYDPALVGSGPRSLNRSASAQLHPAYIEATNLSWQNVGGLKSGQFFDQAGSATDSIIPEFVDQFATPMPIIYLRARAGQPLVPPTTPGYGEDNNGIITYDKSDPNNRVGQYDLHDLLPYTATGIGEGKSIKGGDYQPANSNTNKPFNHGLRTVTVNAVLDKSGGTNYVYPYDAFPYFSNPQSANSPRQKDGYILISAGPDRVYGTSDDICSFGNVIP